MTAYVNDEQKGAYGKAVRRPGRHPGRGHGPRRGGIRGRAAEASRATMSSCSSTAAHSGTPKSRGVRQRRLRWRSMPTASTASTSRTRPTTSYYKDVNGNGAHRTAAIRPSTPPTSSGRHYVLVITCTDKGDYVNQSRGSLLHRCRPGQAPSRSAW
ncbi:MAG: hypothetical protein ACLT98_10770 [Eggerthellaceae bacterium]